MANPFRTSLRLDQSRDRRSSRRPSSGVRKAGWRGWMAIIAWYGLVMLLFTLTLYFHPYESIVGLPARADVVAPYEIRVNNLQATNDRKQELISRRARIWVADGKILSLASQKLHQFTNLLEQTDPQNSDQFGDFSQKLIDQINLAIDSTSLNQFLPKRLARLTPPLTLDQLTAHLGLILMDVLNDHAIVPNKVPYQAHFGEGVLTVIDQNGLPIRPIDSTLVLEWPEEVRSYLQLTALPRYLPGDSYQYLREACVDLLMRLVAPNLVFDKSRSDAQYASQIEELDRNPIAQIFKKGDVISSKDLPLTQLQADALEQLNIQSLRLNSVKFIGILAITAIFFFAVGLYMRRFRRDIMFDAATITLHALPPVMAIAFGQILLATGVDSSVVELCFPAAMVGMLSAILITPQVAFILVLVSSCLFGVASGQALDFLILTLFGGFTAVLASRQIRLRIEVLRVGLQVGLVNVIAVTILTLIHKMGLPEGRDILVAFLNGLACAVATLILLAIFEGAFGLVTDLRLLEMTGIKHPLIAQLEEKAPGTYQHVLNVTKLAEAAAQSIGANALLVRAGAYFHDIGKMVKPKYSSENQVTLEDKRAHSKLSPYMSVLIIKNHVKEGIELAHRWGLPQKIVDFIPEHHGTGLIRFFYSQALKQYEDSEAVAPVREDDFRYPGPKPRSVETAIVMLADSVEAIAASRFTGGQVSESELRRTVQMAISERFNDGQFDECDLTLAQLNTIREALVETLMARYHFRIAYPSLPKREGTPAREQALPSMASPGPVST